MDITLTSAQLRQIADTVTTVEALKSIEVKVKLSGDPAAARYQIHYADGTFGSWVAIDGEGRLLPLPSEKHKPKRRLTSDRDAGTDPSPRNARGQRGPG